jgi:hypothetical protein
MENAKSDILGPIYSAIGREYVHILGHTPKDLYLYAEAGDGYSAAQIFS